VSVNLPALITQIKADTSNFNKGVTDSVRVLQRFNKAGEVVGTSVRVIAKRMDEAKGKTDGFRLAMTRLSRDIKVFQTVSHTAAAAITAVYKAASEGAKIGAAEQFFKNSGKDIEEYRKAARGMVSDAELMKKANLADSMGIDEKTFKHLIQVAEAAALKTGQSFDYMFNSIVVGTARSSRLLLDNLGIIVSVGTANEKYAASIGKTVEALTTEEKQIAFVNEVRAKSSGQLEEYANVVDKSAESFAKFDASIQNTADTIKVALSQAISGMLPALTAMMDGITDLLKDRNWEAVGKYIGLKIAAGIAIPFDSVAGGLIDSITGISGYSSNRRTSSTALNEQAEAALMEARAESPQVARKGTLLAEFNDLKGALLETLPDWADSSWKGIVQSFVDRGSTSFGDLADTLAQQMVMAGKEVGIVWKKTTADAGGGSNTKKPTKAEENAKNRLDFSSDLSDQMSLSEKIAKGDRDEFAALLKASKASLANGEKRWEEINKNLQDAAEEAARNARRAEGKFDRLIQTTAQALGESAGAIASGSGLFGPVLGALAPVIGASVGGPLGAAIGGILPVLGALADGLRPVITFLGYLAKGLTNLVGNALGQLLEVLGPLGPSLGALLGAVGILIRVAVAPLARVLQVVAVVAGGLISIFAAVVTGVASFLQLISAVGQILMSIFGGFTGGLSWDYFISMLDNSAEAMRTFTSRLLESVANINNGIVRWIRTLPGMKSFGTIMTAAQFGLLEDSAEGTDENTEAVRENTKALRDFAREFRNLPQNYKVQGTLFDSADPEIVQRGRGNLAARSQQIGLRSPPSRFANLRDRL
jgi:hypothetical protein